MGPKIHETCGFNTGLARDLQLDPSLSLSAPHIHLEGMVLCHLLRLGRALHGIVLPPASKLPP